MAKMIPQSYSFNRDAKYRVGGVYSIIPGGDTTPYRLEWSDPLQGHRTPVPSKWLKSVLLTQPAIQVQAAVATADPQGSFQAEFQEVFQKYSLPKVTSDGVRKTWYNSPMQFWQNQLNFAVWCATAGCGVSRDDHLQASDPLMRSLFRFHVYYQVRRILVEMKAALPQDKSWEAHNNSYDRRAYERICGEFMVSPHTDWHVKGPNHGLGRVYYVKHGVTYKATNFLGGSSDDWNSKSMSFDKGFFLWQEMPGIDTAWNTFILDKSKGFTQAGVERLNDSIRAYVWAILGAQSQTRTGILGTGTAFDAQKQFLANVEDAISSPVDLPGAIERYQNVLRYAGTEVNYVFGIGLYMAPSDMLLHIGRVTGYNNEIVVASGEQSLGVNAGVNEPHPEAPPVAGPDMMINDTGEKSFVVPLEPHPDPPATQPPMIPSINPQSRQHEDEKTALIVGGVAVGLLALWLLR